MRCWKPEPRAVVGRYPTKFLDKNLNAPKTPPFRASASLRLIQIAKNLSIWQKCCGTTSQNFYNTDFVARVLYAAHNPTINRSLGGLRRSARQESPLSAGTPPL